MRTIEEIKQEANQYQVFLDSAPVEIDNGDILVEFLGQLNNVMSRTGVMMAEAQKICDMARHKVYADEFKRIKELSATIAKNYVETCIADESALVTWVEQLNKTAKHQSDNLRTQISYAKEQLRLEKSGY